MKLYKILISVMLTFSLFNIQLNEIDSIQAKDAVTIDEGTSIEHIIPTDTTGSVEAGLPTGFVQGDSVRLNFEKGVLEGISGYMETVIVDAAQGENGKYIVLVRASNIYTGQSAQYAYLLLVGLDGVVERSVAINEGVSEDGINAIKQPTDTTGFHTEYPSLLIVGNSVYVLYRGITPTSASKSASYFKTDYNLVESSFEWGQMKDFSGGESVYSSSDRYLEFNSVTNTYENKGRLLRETANAKTASTLKYAEADLQTQVQSLDYELEYQGYEDVFGEVYNGIYTKDEITSAFSYLNMLTDLNNGDRLGRVYSFGYVNGVALKPINQLVVWDSAGNIKHIYSNGTASTIVVLHEISDETDIFFIEIKYAGEDVCLKKMNTTTGVVTKVKEYPNGTSIMLRQEKNDVYDSNYMFYGYAADNSGEFEGYGTGAGAVVGYMDENFNIVSANIIETSSPVTLSMIPNGDGNYFTYGLLQENREFANEPTDTTNSIDGNGWIDKSSTENVGRNYDTYVGHLVNKDDYSPAINVGDNLVFNVDDYASQEEIDAVLISSVEVYDSFELSANNLSNSGLTTEEITERFESRINRNPEDITADIDWNALGLDLTKAGNNTVKFFITDSNNQITANSKAIDVTTKNTVQDGNRFLDASNFHISLTDASGLDLTKAKTASSAHAWVEGVGTNLDDKISVNAAELALINTTTKAGIFDLTFTIPNEGGDGVVENTVKVFVGGSYDATNDVVLFGNDFEVMLEDAGDYTPSEAISASEAKAYEVDTNTLLDSGNLGADVSNINSATEVGPQNVSISYTDGTTVVEIVVASIIDDYTVTNEYAALKADSFSIHIDDLGDLTHDKAKENSEVKAWVKKTGTDVTGSVSVNSVQYNVIKGATEAKSYPLTYTLSYAGEELVRNVMVHVLDDGDVANKDNNVVIYANNFKVMLEEAAGYTSGKAVTASEAYAVSFDNATALPTSNISADVTNINNATEVGVADVGVSYTDGGVSTSTTVVASIIDEYTEVNDEIGLRARSFSIHIDDLDGLTEDVAKTTSEVKAWVLATNEILTDSVEVDDTEYTAIRNATEAKSYSLTYRVTYNSKTVENVVMVHVLDDGDVADKDEDIVIYASGFKVALSDASSYSNAIVDSGVYAIEFESGNDLDVSNISADESLVNAATEVGPYNVGLTYDDTERSASTTVIASVYDESVVFGDEDAIAANNIVFSLEEVESLTSTDLRTAVEARSNVRAWDTSTGVDVTYTYDESVIEAKLGTYDLTFTTAFGTEKVIEVYVLAGPECNGNGCDAGDADEVITAEDFEITISEVSGLTETKVIDLGKARAIDLISGDDISVSADYSAIEEKAGSYDVTYTTASGLSKTVKATVGNNLVVIGDGTAAIAANNVVMYDYEVEALNEDRDALNDELVVRSKARAWVVETNEELTPVLASSDAFDFADLTPSSYDVTFIKTASARTEEELSTTSRMTILGDGTVASDIDAIDANDFALVASEVSSLNPTKVVEYAKARSWLIADNSDVEIVDVDYSNIEAKQGIYDVTFTNVYGTKTIVQAFVGDTNRPIIDTDKNIVIFADDYTITVDEANAMTVEEHLEAANVLIIDKDTYEEIEVGHIDISGVLAKVGVYPAVYGADVDVASVVEVTVTEGLTTTGLSMYGMLIALLLAGLVIVIRTRYNKAR